VGSFIGDSWKEWNGPFRDDVRSFFRGENGFVGRFADRLLGSPAIYGHEEREAEQTVNFVTCHDGFTLNDLVTYNHKHNEVNGEENRDGTNDNRSSNCGVEGPTDDVTVNKLRNRQVKNFLTVTIIAAGMPMILMGDEVRRTQLGNNNAYCQDNETSWFDWTLLPKHNDVHRFVVQLNSQRLLRDIESDGGVSLNQLLHQTNLTWHGVKVGQPDWSENSHRIAITVESRREKLLHHLIFNAYWDTLDFELPRVPDAGENPWRRWIDTAIESPQDILSWEIAETVSSDVYRVEAHSVVVLFARV
jgi:isoamylase